MKINSTELIEKLIRKEDLSFTESGWILESMANNTIEKSKAAALLTGLRAKGESATEIRGFAEAMRKLTIKPIIDVNEDTVDIVGTGGDGSGSLNLSTGSALLAAASGVKVIKHGNRSISSKCGSADVIEKLGIPIPLDEKQAGSYLNNNGFTFLFAPHFHPAMKNIGPLRKDLGIRTIFNILGPLVNPAEPPYNVIGAFSLEMAELMAETLSDMKIKRCFVINGALGWDEATPIGPFTCYDVTPGNIKKTIRTPEDYNMPRCNRDDLLGSEARNNCNRMEKALFGEDTLAHRNALIMGASLAIEVVGLEKNIKNSCLLAKKSIENGSAAKLIKKIKTSNKEKI